MTAYGYARGVASETSDVISHPCYSLPHALNDILDSNHRREWVVEQHDGSSVLEERFGHKTVVRFVKEMPPSTVNEYQYRSIRCGRGEDVAGLTPPHPIRNIQEAQLRGSHFDAAAAPALEIVLKIRHGSLI